MLMSYVLLGAFVSVCVCVYVCVCVCCTHTYIYTLKYICALVLVPCTHGADILMHEALRGLKTDA